MHDDRKFGTVKAVDRVTGLAAIFVRFSGELSVVSIVVVAIETLSKFDFIEGVGTCGNMALGALHSRVHPEQRIVRSCVFRYAKARRFPAGNRVAFFAFPV